MPHSENMAESQAAALQRVRPFAPNLLCIVIVKGPNNFRLRRQGRYNSGDRRGQIVDAAPQDCRRPPPKPTPNRSHRRCGAQVRTRGNSDASSTAPATHGTLAKPAVKTEARATR
jgi:hypothetical protein